MLYFYLQVYVDFHAYGEGGTKGYDFRNSFVIVKNIVFYLLVIVLLGSFLIVLALLSDLIFCEKDGNKKTGKKIQLENLNISVNNWNLTVKLGQIIDKDVVY